MPNTLFVAPTANFVQTTLNGAINDATATITVNSVTNVQAPGYAVIDRQNSAGTNTPNSREVVYFTGVSGSNLTGCVRAADGSTARSHSDGAIVEFSPTVGMWNSLATIVSTAMTGDGYLKALISPVSLSILEVPTKLSVSGASVVGLTQLNPVFQFVGFLSGPTTLLQTPLVLPKSGTWDWVTILTRTVASVASVIIDVNKNGTSIFDAGTRPSFAAGGTLVSTASIATKAFAQGDRLSWDIDTAAGVGLHVTDLVIQLKSN